MDDRLKRIIKTIVIVLAALFVISGIGYARQRFAASKGVEYLEQKEYQKAYEEFDSAASRFTLFFTKQKKNVLFYEGEALYQIGEYDKAIEVYDKLIRHGQSRAYSFKAYCLMQQKKQNEALSVCEEGIDKYPKEGELYCTKYAIYAKDEKYKQGLKVINAALENEDLNNKKEVLFARISAYESMFDFDTAYKYAKAYVKEYPTDAQGKKELTFLETR